MHEVHVYHTHENLIETPNDYLRIDPLRLISNLSYLYVALT